jgi:hypothetical protein
MRKSTRVNWAQPPTTLPATARGTARQWDSKQVEAAGIELPQQYAGNSGVGGESGAESGALGAQNGPVDPDLAAVMEAWPGLPAAIRAGILAMVRAAK